MAFHQPEPEILTREDTEHSQWDVEECPPKRGLPATEIVNKRMIAPADDSDMSRCIRAHEMMHAKVSPANEWQSWIDRGMASRQALEAVEELRVNLLCQEAGFNMKEHLSDDGETYDGERIGANDDWASAVYMTIACAGTASLKKYLTGIRRNNRLWGKALKRIATRAEREMRKSYFTGRLASTEVHEQSGLAPYGFFFTESIAEWIDRLASTPPPEPDPDPVNEVDEEKVEKKSTNEEGDGDREHSNVGRSKPRVFEEWEERLKAITHERVGSYRNDVPVWEELRIAPTQLNVHAPGSIGKKRIASNMGRHPRRLHRLLTDPQRRIFDRTIHGKGGVVVIDCSGSMSLSIEEIKQILLNAPGATILGYSDMGDEKENAYILAHKGKMVSEIPAMGGGNGVDHPALEWGIRAKQRPTSPVIFITDGGVCGKNSSFLDSLAMQCIKTIMKNNVLTYEHVEDSIEALKMLSRGEKPQRNWARMVKEVWYKQRGTRLTASTTLG